MAQMYKNIKNGMKAEFIERNDKAGHVTLKKEEGGFTSPLIGSFEKYWRPINESGKIIKEDAPKIEETQEAIAPVTEDTATATEEPKAEGTATEQEKPKKAKAEKKPKMTKEERNKVALEYMAKGTEIAKSQGFDVKTYSGMPTDMAVVNKVGKRLFEIYFGNKKWSVYTSDKRIPEGTDFTTIKNSFNASIQMQYDDTFESKLKEVLGWALPEDNAHPKKKDMPKKEKKSKKDEKEEQ